METLLSGHQKRKRREAKQKVIASLTIPISNFVSRSNVSPVSESSGSDDDSVSPAKTSHVAASPCARPEDTDIDSHSDSISEENESSEKEEETQTPAIVTEADAANVTDQPKMARHSLALNSSAFLQLEITPLIRFSSKMSHLPLTLSAPLSNMDRVSLGSKMDLIISPISRITEGSTQAGTSAR